MSRVELLNNRIDILREFFESLHIQMSHSHDTYRGAIIVWLIVLYVVIEAGCMCFGISNIV